MVQWSFRWALLPRFRRYVLEGTMIITNYFHNFLSNITIIWIILLSRFRRDVLEGTLEEMLEPEIVEEDEDAAIPERFSDHDDSEGDDSWGLDILICHCYCLISQNYCLDILSERFIIFNRFRRGANATESERVKRQADFPGLNKKTKIFWLRFFLTNFQFSGDPKSDPKK